RVLRVVGRPHQATRGVGRGRPRHAPGRGRRRDGATGAPPPRPAPGGARGGGRGRVGRARPGGVVKAFPSPGALARRWPPIRPYPWRLAGASVCLIASAAVGPALPRTAPGR